MRFLSALFCLIVVIPTFAAVGVDVSSTTDSVMKVVYTGGTPTGSQPVLSVSGKKFGVWSVANDITDGTGVTGLGPYGVIGSSQRGSGYVVGIQGDSWGDEAYGAKGYANGYGVEGSLTYGVWAQGYQGQTNYGIFAYADGSEHANSYAYGVYGTAVGGGAENWAGWFDGNVYVSGTVGPSDIMFKRDVQPLTGGLAKLMQLRPKRYFMKADEFKDRIQLPKGEQFGLIAQDLQEVYPQLVTDATAPVRLTKAEQEAKVKKAALKFKSVNYSALIPVLIEALQEQQSQIEALKAELASSRK